MESTITYPQSLNFIQTGEQAALSESTPEVAKKVAEILENISRDHQEGGKKAPKKNKDGSTPKKRPDPRKGLGYQAYETMLKKVLKDQGIDFKTAGVAAKLPANKIIKALKERVKSMHPNLDTVAVYEKVDQMYQSSKK